MEWNHFAKHKSLTQSLKYYLPDIFISDMMTMMGAEWLNDCGRKFISFPPKFLRQEVMLYNDPLGAGVKKTAGGGGLYPIRVAWKNIFVKINYILFVQVPEGRWSISSNRIKISLGKRRVCFYLMLWHSGNPKHI